MIDSLSQYARARRRDEHKKYRLMRRTFRTAAAGAAVLVLAGGFAAGEAKHARGSHARSSDPTGEPIVIGNIGTVSKAYAKYSEYAPMQKAVQAWADWTNRNGGINGRPIRVEVADDDNSVAKHYSLVQQMVEQKHVTAFVGNPAVDTQPASARYLEEKGVPAIGGSLGNAIWGRSTMLFPHGIAETNKARMLMQAAALTGKHKFAFLTVPKSPRELIIKALRSGPAQEAGIEVIFDSAVQEGRTADNSPACLAAKKAGVEIVTIAGDFETIASVMESCAKSGFNPAYVTTGTITSPEYLKAVGKNGEGTIGVSRFLPWEGDKPAELKTYREIMKSHGLELNQATLSGYISARIFEEAVKRIKGEVTPASVVQALRSLNGSDLNGLVAPLGFSTSSGEFNPGSLCFWPLIVKNGQWKPKPGKGSVCLKEQQGAMVQQPGSGTQGKLAVPGASLYYEIHGSGPLVVMVPGAAGTAFAFQAVKEYLAKQFSVVLFDRRGFARSPLTGPQNYDKRLETEADDVRRLIEHSSREPAIVFGSSSGGLIALELLTRHPSVVRTIVVQEAPAVKLLPDGGKQWIDAFLALYEDYRKIGLAQAQKKFLEKAFVESDVIAVQRVSDPENPVAVANGTYWFEHELRQYPQTNLNLDVLKSRADKIVLLVGRENTPGHPASDANIELGKKLGLENIQVPGGHLGFISYPAEYGPALLEVITRASSAKKP